MVIKIKRWQQKLAKNACEHTVLLWDRKWRRYKANVFVEVFPVPCSRATTMVLRVTTTGRGRV